MVRVGLVVLALLAIAPGSVKAQASLPVVEDVDLDRLRSHGKRLRQVLTKLGAPMPEEKARVLQRLLQEENRDPAAAEKVQELLDPLCLVGVTINPESRVKAQRGPATAVLREGRDTVVLAKIHNDAGVTHRLTVSGSELLSADQRGPGRWLEVAVRGAAGAGDALSGQKLEYVILRLTPRQVGKREATLTFDVGQGTQDLGFRADVPVLFTVQPAPNRGR